MPHLALTCLAASSPFSVTCFGFCCFSSYEEKKFRNWAHHRTLMCSIISWQAGINIPLHAAWVASCALVFKQVTISAIEVMASSVNRVVKQLAFVAIKECTAILWSASSPHYTWRERQVLLSTAIIVIPKWKWYRRCPWYDPTHVTLTLLPAWMAYHPSCSCVAILLLLACRSIIWKFSCLTIVSPSISAIPWLIFAFMLYSLVFICIRTYKRVRCWQSWFFPYRTTSSVPVVIQEAWTIDKQLSFHINPSLGHWRSAFSPINLL